MIQKEFKGYTGYNKIARLSKNENDIDRIIEDIQEYGEIE
jgi:hypothetical protein